jgi:hypothetical protein
MRQQSALVAWCFLVLLTTGCGTRQEYDNAELTAEHVKQIDGWMAAAFREGGGHKKLGAATRESAIDELIRFLRERKQATILEVFTHESWVVITIDVGRNTKKGDVANLLNSVIYNRDSDEYVVIMNARS